MGKKIIYKFNPMKYHDGPPEWLKELTIDQLDKLIKIEEEKVRNPDKNEDPFNRIIEIPD